MDKIAHNNDLSLKKNNIMIATPAPDTMAQSILSDALFPERKPSDAMDTEDDAEAAIKKEDPLSAQVWRLYTKAKDTLPNGARLENLTWRMMAMTLNKKQKVPSSPTTTTQQDVTDQFVDSSAPIVDHSYSPLSPSHIVSQLKAHQKLGFLVSNLN